MSLYDDASLVMIPTAVKDGKLYNIKPDPNPISRELVLNGTFDTDSNWTKQTGWSISGGSANCNTNSSFQLYQDNVVQTNKFYKITYTVSNYQSGGVFFRFNTVDGDVRTANGTYTEYLKATNSPFGRVHFRTLAQGGFIGSINNVSVVEVDELPADFTFNRGSNLAATRVNKSGLIEKGRENLLLQSNQFDTTWVNNTGGSIVGGQEGYDGSNNAWELNKSADSYRRIQQSVNLSDIWTFSVYAKAGSLNIINLRDETNAIRVQFDLSNGTVSQNFGAILTNVENIGNGWYRCSATYDRTCTRVQIYVDWNQTTAGNVYIQNAQLEQGLVATDYIESGATTGKAGILEDLPRLDYSGGASCPSLLLEPTRTNFLLASEYFDLSTGWNRGGTITQTNNYGISPEGKKNSTRLQLGNDVLIYRGLQAPFDGARSLYVKATSGSGTIQLLSHYTNTDNIFTIDENWQRVELTDVQQVSQNFYLVDTRGGSNTTIFDIEVWGAQYELGNYSTSYIPTYGTSVTRNFSLLSKYDLVNSTSQTLFIECGQTKYAGGGGEFIFEKTNPVAAIFRIYVELSSTNVSRIRFRTEYPVNNYDFTLGNKDEFKKIALSINGSTVKIFGNGSLLGTYQVTVVELEQFNWRVQNSTYSTKQLALFPTALTDQECIELTTL